MITFQSITVHFNVNFNMTCWSTWENTANLGQSDYTSWNEDGISDLHLRSAWEDFK